MHYTCNPKIDIKWLSDLKFSLVSFCNKFSKYFMRVKNVITEKNVFLWSHSNSSEVNCNTGMKKGRDFK